MPNRASATIMARTLTCGAGSGPVAPHWGHVTRGYGCCAQTECRRAFHRDHRANAMRTFTVRPSCHWDRNRSTISGNQTRCASPAGIAQLFYGGVSHRRWSRDKGDGRRVRVPAIRGRPLALDRSSSVALWRRFSWRCQIDAAAFFASNRHVRYAGRLRSPETSNHSC